LTFNPPPRPTLRALQVTIPHQRMVPVFLILTDVYSVDDEALLEFRKKLRGIVREVDGGVLTMARSIELVRSNEKHFHENRVYLRGILSSLSLS
jgi:hypothetical protein